jgi:hypothetical protein
MLKSEEWLVAFYVYEIPAHKHREERNWTNEKEAVSAIKHVARRALTEGAPQDAQLTFSEKKTGNILYQGPLNEASKGVTL